MTASTQNISPEEQEQILQTIEMFEVITQANPHDSQSLEILKEAYGRLGRETEMLKIAQQLAQTYVELGQFSSATLEYESILQRQPDNPEIIAALGDVEERLAQSGQKMPGAVTPREANGFSLDFQTDPADPANLMTTASTMRLQGSGAGRGRENEPRLSDDGNEGLAKFLVHHRLVSQEVAGSALERVQKRNKELRPNTLAASLLDEICRRGAMEMEGLLSSILDRAKFAYIPLEYYDVDRSVVKMLAEELTLGRLIVPFDVVSRTIMIATPNPFDAQGKEAVQQLLDYNVQWHLAAPQAIFKVLGEVYRLEK